MYENNVLIFKNSCQCCTKSSWNNSDADFRWYSPYFSYDKVTRSYTFSCNLKWIRSCGGRLSFCFKFWSKTSLCYALIFLILWELQMWSCMSDMAWNKYTTKINGQKFYILHWTYNLLAISNTNKYFMLI